MRATLKNFVSGIFLKKNIKKVLKTKIILLLFRKHFRFENLF